MKDIDLKKYLQDFINQPELELIRQYRILTPGEDIEDQINKIKRENIFINHINESEDSNLNYEDIKVMAPEEVVAILRERYKNKNEKWIQINERANDIVVVAIIPSLENNTLRFINDMEKCGYFNSTYDSIIDENGNRWWGMIFEPYHTINITESVLKYKYHIMHATPRKNVESIMKNGIIPSHKNKAYSYPPRVYFMFTDQILGGAFVIKRFIQVMTEVSGIDDYSLVFIKPQLLDEGIHFYIDPEQDNAIYTYQKINPEAIVKCIDDYKTYSPYAE